MRTNAPYSRLLRNQPLGIGTPLVECLTSFIIRLANTHHVFLYRLVLNEIYSALRKNTTDDLSKRFVRLSHSWWDRASVTLNAANQQTEAWVSILGELTKREDLQFLTLLTYKDIFPYRGLIKATAAACFECYGEGSKIGQIYDPLIWQIEPILVCPKHGSSLQTSCPYCRKSLTSLGPRHYAGSCPHCSRCLDANLTATEPNLSLSEREEHTYFVSSIGELLTAAPTLNIPPNRNNISVVIQRAIKELFDGNGKRFALALGLHHKTLYELRDGTQLPQIGSPRQVVM